MNVSVNPPRKPILKLPATIAATMRTHSNGQRGTGIESRWREDPLLIVSNRGPVEHYRDRSGEIHLRRAGGGLATALAGVAKARPVTWLASPVTAADRDVLASGGGPEFDEGPQLHLVDSPRDTYDLFYGTFCNPLLWFLQHSLWETLLRDDPAAEALYAWERGYVPVNEAFAMAVVRELRSSSRPQQVMLQDYQLYLVPSMIRRRASDAVLQHFVHIPWPTAETWRALPQTITAAICGGLLANDSVTFQTERCARHFVATCQDALLGVRQTADGVLYGGRRTRVWANPISVDVKDLRQRVASARARTYAEKLAPKRGEKTILRVDRLDPSKDVTGGFRSFARLLEGHPEWHGRVRFLACLVPSRSKIPEYKEYTEDALALAEGINVRHGTKAWTPVTIYLEENRTQALAAMQAYDVLLVNSIADGMNLVSKEGPIVNDRDGVLVLSKTAGSYAELRRGALVVEPGDVDGTAEALHAALTMPPDERSRRAQTLRAAIERHDLDDWLQLQIEDVERGRVAAQSA